MLEKANSFKILLTIKNEITHQKMQNSQNANMQSVNSCILIILFLNSKVTFNLYKAVCFWHIYKDILWKAAIIVTCAILLWLQPFAIYSTKKIKSKSYCISLHWRTRAFQNHGNHFVQKESSGGGGIIILH